MAVLKRKRKPAHGKRRQRAGAKHQQIGNPGARYPPQKSRLKGCGWWDEIKFKLPMYDGSKSEYTWTELGSLLRRAHEILARHARGESDVPTPTGSFWGVEDIPRHYRKDYDERINEARYITSNLGKVYRKLADQYGTPPELEEKTAQAHQIPPEHWRAPHLRHKRYLYTSGTATGTFTDRYLGPYSSRRPEEKLHEPVEYRGLLAPRLAPDESHPRVTALNTESRAARTPHPAGLDFPPETRDLAPELEAALDLGTSAAPPPEPRPTPTVAPPEAFALEAPAAMQIGEGLAGGNWRTDIKFTFPMPDGSEAEYTYKAMRDRLTAADDLLWDIDNDYAHTRHEEIDPEEVQEARFLRAVIAPILRDISNHFLGVDEFPQPPHSESKRKQRPYKYTEFKQLPERKRERKTRQSSLKADLAMADEEYLALQAALDQPETEAEADRYSQEAALARLKALTELHPLTAPAQPPPYLGLGLAGGAINPAASAFEDLARLDLAEINRARTLAAHLARDEDRVLVPATQALEWNTPVGRMEQAALATAARRGRLGLAASSARDSEYYPMRDWARAEMRRRELLNVGPASKRQAERLRQEALAQLRATRRKPFLRSDYSLANPMFAATPEERFLLEELERESKIDRDHPPGDGAAQAYRDAYRQAGLRNAGMYGPMPGPPIDPAEAGRRARRQYRDQQRALQAAVLGQFGVRLPASPPHSPPPSPPPSPHAGIPNAPPLGDDDFLNEIQANIEDAERHASPAALRAIANVLEPVVVEPPAPADAALLANADAANAAFLANAARQRLHFTPPPRERKRASEASILRREAAARQENQRRRLADIARADSIERAQGSQARRRPRVVVVPISPEQQSDEQHLAQELARRRQFIEDEDSAERPGLGLGDGFRRYYKRRPLRGRGLELAQTRTKRARRRQLESKRRLLGGTLYGGIDSAGQGANSNFGYQSTINTSSPEEGVWYDPHPATGPLRTGCAPYPNTNGGFGAETRADIADQSWQFPKGRGAVKEALQNTPYRTVVGRPWGFGANLGGGALMHVQQARALGAGTGGDFSFPIKYGLSARDAATGHFGNQTYNWRAAAYWGQRNRGLYPWTPRDTPYSYNGLQLSSASLSPDGAGATGGDYFGQMKVDAHRRGRFGAGYPIMGDYAGTRLPNGFIGPARNSRLITPLTPGYAGNHDLGLLHGGMRDRSGYAKTKIGIMPVSHATI